MQRVGYLQHLRIGIWRMHERGPQRFDLHLPCLSPARGKLAPLAGIVTARNNLLNDSPCVINAKNGVCHRKAFKNIDLDHLGRKALPKA